APASESLPARSRLRRGIMPLTVQAGPVRWRDIVRIHRLEFPFPVNYACQAVWGACFAVAAPSGLLAGPVLLTLLASLILLVAQNPLNAAGDLVADSAVPGKVSIGT